MAIELDAEQLAYVRKHHIDLTQSIDFPCSPAFASFYASQGMTRDYPPEYYQNRIYLNKEMTETEFLSRLKILEQKNLSGPATKQEVYELKHLVNKLTERVNYLTKERGAY